MTNTMDFELLKKTKITPRPDTFHDILKEYYSKCTFFQFLSSYGVAKNFKYESRQNLHIVNEKDLDLLVNRLNHPRELEVLENLTKEIPNLPKITLGTKTFDSPIADVLKVIAKFKKLKELEIVIEENERKWKHFETDFQNLKSLDLRLWSHLRFDGRKNAEGILESILSSCNNLKMIRLENCNIKELSIISLLSNKKLTDISLLNVKYETDYNTLKSIFSSNRLEYVCLKENKTTRFREHYLATEIFLKEIKHNNKLKTVKLTVFSDPLLQYGNINKLRKLKRIVIYIPFEHSIEIRTNFIKLIDALTEIDVCSNRKILISIVRFNMGPCTEYIRNTEYNSEIDPLSFENYIKNLPRSLKGNLLYDQNWHYSKDFSR